MLGNREEYVRENYPTEKCPREMFVGNVQGKCPGPKWHIREISFFTVNVHVFHGIYWVIPYVIVACLYGYGTIW